MATSPSTLSTKTLMLQLIVSTVLIVNVLFFIDEGWYDFRWMQRPGNWFVFGVYCAILFLLQSLCYWVIFARKNFKGKVAASAAGGFGLLILFMILVSFGN
jgi:hypothetical protein